MISMRKQLCESKYECCGCAACFSVCPVNAIKMVEDEEGFKYPYINQELCINCKKCETVCPLKVSQSSSMPLHIYATKNRDEEIRRRSSSGGVFSLLAAYVEAQNGVIYGAAFDENYSVCHMRAETVEQWKAFCVSKYVQSDIGETFRCVGDDLKKGRRVLFSGTPCQIDGLKSYIRTMKIDYAGLYTCDIVCHGTPSPVVWKDYLEYLQKREKKNIGFVSFRDKGMMGWHNSTLTIKDREDNAILSETQKDNFFFQLFVCHEILRPSCYRCKYASFYRPGDITLGDFWGIEKHFPQFDDDKGVSLVMINTEAGRKMWEEVKQYTEYFEVEKEQCIQPNLQKPSKESKNREMFWAWYNKYGLKRVGQRMGFLPMNKTEKLLILLCRCREKIRNTFF